MTLSHSCLIIMILELNLQQSTFVGSNCNAFRTSFSAPSWSFSFPRTSARSNQKSGLPGSYLMPTPKSSSAPLTSPVTTRERARITWTSGTSFSCSKAAEQSSTAPSKSSSRNFASARRQKIFQRLGSSLAASSKSAMAPLRSPRPIFASALRAQSVPWVLWMLRTFDMSSMAPSKSCVCNFTLPRLRHARRILGSCSSASLQSAIAPSGSSRRILRELLMAVLPGRSSKKYTGAALARPQDPLGLAASCEVSARTRARRMRRK
mmetsp:Transcript_82987/g.216280  ORF Transcript_82987/g.216280 Transcript_82987/m.216280 type:complete len:264 (+) Transcript_82987:643-1434(+)